MAEGTLRRPNVTIHYAQTLDGRIATRTGQSRWIGGEASLRFAHRLRSEHGAVMVGVGTVLADNPRLTVRLVEGPSPLRVVLDSTLRLPLHSCLLADGARGTLVATTSRAPTGALAAVRHLGARVLVVGEDGAGRVDLAALLRELAALGVHSVLIEGGRGVITSALRSRLADRLVVCISPKLVGAGIEAVGDLGIDLLSEAVCFPEAAFTRVGEDLIFDGRMARDGETRGRGDAETATDPDFPLPMGEGQGGGSGRSPHGLGSSAVAKPLSPTLSHGERGIACAVWFPARGRVEIREESIGEVGPGEVRVRAVASALSHGTEMLVYRGQVPTELALDLPALRGSFGFPIKYGYASVGRVVEVGGDARGLAVGELVFVHHPHQTDYVVPASSAIALPPGTDPEAGVFLANLETAVNVMLDAGMRLGERVVIFGQGTVGLLLTRLARRAGAGLVVAVDPLPRRRDLAVAMGADEALAPGDGLAEEVRRLTGGVGADLALEASGNGEALASALDCVAFQGTVVVCSWYGTKPVALMLGAAFHRGRLRLVSSQVSSIDPALQPRWSRERRLALALKLLAELRLAPIITHRIPFERAAEAYDLVDRHRDEVVQVILTYDGRAHHV